MSTTEVVLVQTYTQDGSRVIRGKVHFFWPSEMFQPRPYVRVECGKTLFAGRLFGQLSEVTCKACRSSRLFSGLSSDER